MRKQSTKQRMRRLSRDGHRPQTARPDLRRWPARFALLLALGLAPWPGVREQSDAVFRGLANPLLHWVQFGDGSGLGRGSAVLLQTEPKTARSADDGPAWDTRLRLSVGGVSEAKDVIVSPRRMAFVPCWVLLSVVLASPLSFRRKLCCLLAGVPLLLAAAMASIATTAAWIFSQVPGLVYASSPFHRTAVEIAYRAFVVPTSNRFIVPLLLGAALLAWQRPASHVAASSSVRRRFVQMGS